MKFLVSTAVVAGLAAGAAMAPVTAPAGPLKRAHATPVSQDMPDPRIPRAYPDASGGNAAAGGNNANSMTGSNSAAENANGRTSGGAGFGG